MSTPSMKIIAFTNAKGGVGKTTSSCNVGLELASRDFRVLMVDLDPQADTTKAFGVETKVNTVGDVLLNQAKIKDCIQPVRWLNDEDEREVVPNLFLLPSSIMLGVHEPQISEKKDYELLLLKKLQEVATCYDFVIIDCPPALGTLTYMAFCAADAYVIPSAAEQLSYNKIALVRNVADSIQKRLNPRLKFAGIVFTRHNSEVKRILNKAIVLAAHAQHGRENVLPSIRQDILLSEAQAQQVPVRLYSPKSNGADDYAKLTTAILKRL